MTENEAKEILRDFDKQVAVKANAAYQTNAGIEACEVAIKALEEVQQYRAIDTVEDIRETYSLCKILQNVVDDYSSNGTVLQRFSTKKSRGNENLNAVN